RHQGKAVPVAEVAVSLIENFMVFEASIVTVSASALDAPGNQVVLIFIAKRGHGFNALRAVLFIGLLLVFLEIASRRQLDSNAALAGFYGDDIDSAGQAVDAVDAGGRTA